MTAFSNGHSRSTPRTVTDGASRTLAQTPAPANPKENRLTPTEEEVVAHTSPEGRPEHAGPRLGGTLSLIMFGGALIGGLAVLVGVTSGWAAGLVVLVFGLGVGLLTNPEIGTAILRGQERDRAHADLHDDDINTQVIHQNDADFTEVSASRHNDNA